MRAYLTPHHQKSFVIYIYSMFSHSSKKVHEPEINDNTSSTNDWWYIGIQGDGGVKSKGTRLLI